MSAQVTMATDASQTAVAAYVYDDSGGVVVDMQGEVEGSADAVARAQAALSAAGVQATPSEGFEAYALSYGLRTSSTVTLQSMTRDDAVEVVARWLAKRFA